MRIHNDFGCVSLTTISKSRNVALQIVFARRQVDCSRSMCRLLLAPTKQVGGPIEWREYCREKDPSDLCVPTRSHCCVPSSRHRCGCEYRSVAPTEWTQKSCPGDTEDDYGCLASTACCAECTMEQVGTRFDGVHAIDSSRPLLQQLSPRTRRKLRV